MRYVVFLAIAIAVAAALFLLLRSEPNLIDDAALLNESERAFVSEYHGYLVDDHEIDYRVVTTASDEPILEEAVELFERLGVGSRSDWSRGLLLVINPTLDKVRLEVGYALEGVFPDAFVAYVEQRQMVPFFRDGRVSDGILATTELIVDRAQRARTRGGFDPDEVWIEGSGGAGAQTRARIGETDTSQANVDTDDDDRLMVVADSPEQALSIYIRAMDARNASPTLPIYSSLTQAMLRDRTVTPAQMDHVVRTYRECTPQPTRYSASGKFAVIRYDAAARQCAPWFFVRTDGHWTLDLASMSQSIRFGRTNAWHRSTKGFGNYAFGFDDWRFDGNGYPVE